MKPILFNTEMVRAIQEGRKTVTRRVVKPQPASDTHPNLFVSPPYHPGDILWVRETWARKVSDRCVGYSGVCAFESCETAPGPCFCEEYIYKATDSLPPYIKAWRPSIHMPKEAARLFLRVTGVRAERLQDITEEGAKSEGADTMTTPNIPGVGRTYRQGFGELWNSTIKPADRPLYGWEANPWVWVIEFERVSREVAIGGGGDE